MQIHAAWDRPENEQCPLSFLQPVPAEMLVPLSNRAVITKGLYVVTNCFINGSLTCFEDYYI